mmetsp:Transcript_20979/g.83630  ORF Transcript_20979/g.83630 Transcript_20979/m.83630 type:complete len:308 (+) Transcript_20979:725-1648(+)
MTPGSLPTFVVWVREHRSSSRSSTWCRLHVDVTPATVTTTRVLHTRRLRLFRWWSVSHHAGDTQPPLEAHAAPALPRGSVSWAKKKKKKKKRKESAKARSRRSSRAAARDGVLLKEGRDTNQALTNTTTLRSEDEVARGRPRGGRVGRGAAAEAAARREVGALGALVRRERGLDGPVLREIEDVGEGDRLGVAAQHFAEHATRRQPGEPADLGGHGVFAREPHRQTRAVHDARLVQFGGPRNRRPLEVRLERVGLAHGVGERARRVGHGAPARRLERHGAAARGHGTTRELLGVRWPRASTVVERGL